MQAKQVKRAQMKLRQGEKYLNSKKHIKDSFMEKYEKSYQYLCDPSTDI